MKKPKGSGPSWPCPACDGLVWKREMKEGEPWRCEQCGRTLEAAQAVADKKLRERTRQIILNPRGRHATVTIGDDLEPQALQTTQEPRGPKPRMDLLPWRAIRRVAELLTANIAKHGERGGTLADGVTEQEVFNSAARHLAALGAGQTDEDHAAALAFNALALVELRLRGKEDAQP